MKNGRKIIKKTLILLYFACVLIAAEGEKETYTLSPIVVTGTRAGRPVRGLELVYPKTKIALPEALKDLPGLDLQMRGSPGSQADISIRGSNYQQVLILVDGTRVNDPQTAHHNMDLPVPLSAIEKIEVLKGQASSVYGADALGGVINIITRKADKENIFLGFGYGSYNTRNYELGYENTLGAFSGQLQFQHIVSDGYSFDTDLSNYLVFCNTGYKYDIGETAIKLGYMEKAFGAFDFYTPGKNYPSREWTKTYFVELVTKNDLDARIETEVKAHFRKHNDTFMLNLTKPGLFVNEHVSFDYGVEIQGTLKIEDENYIVAGAAAAQNEIYSSNLGNHMQLRQAIFLEWNGQIIKELKADAGLRLENSGWGSILAPSIAMSYKPDINIKLTASFGYSFRSPSFTELYYADGVSFGNSALKPETAVSYDLGINYYFCKGLSTDLSIYARDETDLIDWIGNTPVGNWYAQNIGRANVYGIEGSLKLDILFCEINTGVSFIYAKKEVNAGYYSKYALLYPSAQVSCSVKGPELLEIVPEVEVLHKRKTGVNDYILLNAKLSRDVGGIIIYIEGQNLTNAVYEEIKGIIQPGITVNTGIKLKL